MKTLNIKSPFNEETLKNLKTGDQILITGVIYVARDAAHKRMVDALDQGKPLPFDIKGQTIYYMGPIAKYIERRGEGLHHLGQKPPLLDKGDGNDITFFYIG